MKNQDTWKPSRIIEKDGKYIPNNLKFELCSRYMAHIIVSEYSGIISENSKGHILDCGCGQVPYYLIYKNYVKQVTCIDWDVADIEHDYLDYKVDLNKPLTFSEDNQFDTILLADVLEHIYEPKQLLSELSRILKPNGRLMVFVPFYYWVHSEPYDYQRYTEFALKKMTEDSNMKVILLKPYGGYFDILFDLINKFFVNREFTAKLLLRIAKSIKKSKYYKKRLEQRIRNFPLGYVLVAEKY